MLLPLPTQNGSTKEGPLMSPGQHALASKLVEINCWPSTWLIWGPVPAGKSFLLQHVSLRSALGGEKTHGALCGLTILCSRQSLSFQSDSVRMDQVRGSWERKMEFRFISTGVCGPCRLLCIVRSWLLCRGMTPGRALPPQPQHGSPSLTAQGHGHIHTGTYHSLPPAEGVQGWRRNEPVWKTHPVFEGKLPSEGFRFYRCLVEMGFVSPREHTR